MTAYATRQDVYRYGLPRGALGNPGRLAASATAANDWIELQEHGFVLGDALTVRAADGGSLPAPLVAGVVYYAIPLTDSTFQVSATPTGGPIAFTTDGVSVIVGADLPIDQLLERYSRFADGFIPAHVVPLPAPYPVTVVAVVAELTAHRLQILSGMSSESMVSIEASAAKQLERWAATLPVRDATNAAPANLAISHHVRDRRIGPRFNRNGTFGVGSDVVGNDD